VTTGVISIRRGPADAPNLAEQAYRQIHRMIMRCELAPSAEVTQSELVASTGLGRSPVREALARLTAEGLMISRPRFGYQVAPITLADIREIFALREIVESAAAELACQRATDADFDQLDALCVAPDQAQDVETIMARNRDFHLLIGRLSGNRRLADVIERLVWESDRFFCYQAYAGFPLREVPTAHQRLVQVMRSRDRDSVRLLAASDARSAAANLIELLVSARDPRPWPVSG